MITRDTVVNIITQYLSPYEIANVNFVNTLNDVEVDNPEVWFISVTTNVNLGFIILITDKSEVTIFQEEVTESVAITLSSHSCGICKRDDYFLELEELMELGWCPEAFLGEDQIDDPICPSCMDDYVISDPVDGTMGVNAERIMEVGRNKERIKDKFRDSFIKRFWPYLLQPVKSKEVNSNAP